jgi:excinuclease ABC subunit A
VPKPGVFASMKGHEGFKSAVLVDQSPLGRTARGNAATYTHAWDRVRARFAAEPEALRRGLTPAHFSFNVPGKGRCETCSGEGYETVEMQFLADVMLLCPVCQGKRFNTDVLSVKHAGVTVADVLAMTVDEVIAAFSPAKMRDYVIENTLKPLARVGLGYLPLGQPLSTLSGGEAQRLKLARALASEAKGSLFLIDEPSAGLHDADVRQVLAALHELVERGASVVVVDHDLVVMRGADWIIDLGPGGGRGRAPAPPRAGRARAPRRPRGRARRPPSGRGASPRAPPRGSDGRGRSGR